ncbi:2-phosphosulfolactate phosphatase [Microbacterium sp. E-13]|uniref:2-phosphosulfolactate phosphatase n=1 Tax=Microbacterium sp. E-13 TaxID=3404048 RepID=UPI003CF4934B
MPESPFDQHRYQVRHDWGIEGLERLAPADVVVIVDVLGLSTMVTDALDSPPSAAPGGTGGSAIAEAASATGAVVLLGCLRNAGATAKAVLDVQHRRAERTSIAVIAAGALAQAPRPEGQSVRFAVEDQLGAGAVIDALGSLGIDHTSPEAAAACEAFRGLRGALRHLLTASGSGRQQLDRGARDEVLNAAALDAASVVPVLRGGAFVAY